ncbi:unnamed protein product [Adineta ricciae]|uniref:Uncharacterized protein n=1 Tax=Adineta ricciae TaxID=249248 RepID=A0A815KPD4_ADIRI|nr:unnamed protein product [Adineta ricciae]CAF1592719.1 unnamed protein product [Adineta ricciae]
MNRQRPSQTTTVQELRNRCEDLILVLRDPSADVENDPAANLVKETRERVDARFNELLNEYLSYDKEKVHPILLQALEEATDQEAFLKAFILSLYYKANQIEEQLVSQHLSNDEDERLSSLMMNKTKDDDNKKHEQKKDEKEKDHHYFSNIIKIVKERIFF